MTVHKTFGKLGQRGTARIRMRMPAELVLSHQIVRAELVNISRTEHLALAQDLPGAAP